jgi:hypothetical protein
MKQQGPYLKPPDPSTTRSWRRRRAWFALPAAVIAITTTANLFYRHGDLLMVIAYVAGVAVLCGGIVAGLAIVDRRRQSLKPSDALFFGFGRFQLSELKCLPQFQWVVGGINPRPIQLWGRGWVEGTVALTPNELAFSPGAAGRDAHIRGFVIRWSDVAQIEVVHQFASLGAGLQVTFLEGTRLGFEIRGRRKVEEALSSIRRHGATLPALRGGGASSG